MLRTPEGWRIRVFAGDQPATAVVYTLNHEASGDAAARTITLLAPSKTYNIAGLACSLAVIADTKLRSQFVRSMAGWRLRAERRHREVGLNSYYGNFHSGD